MSTIPGSSGVLRRRLRPDRVWTATAAGLAMLALADAPAVATSLRFVAESLLYIGPFLVAAVVMAAYSHATGLDARIALAFSGSPGRAIVLAATFGALSPFCSCGVIPIVAALLVAGVPLAPVMAFWLASPLMDPEMFLLTTGGLGLEFATVKALAAIAIGLLGGTLAHALTATGTIGPILRAGYGQCSGCGLPHQELVWRFWTDDARRARFIASARGTGLFLLKWLVLAFFLESLMVAYVPTEAIVRVLGGEAWWAVPVGVLVGIPSYLNGYAAIPMVSGLMELGMVPQAGLAFMLAGGVTSIPAAMAVWAVVRLRVFLLYIACGVAGAVLFGYAYGLYLA